jgi:hypothetical protein
MNKLKLLLCMALLVPTVSFAGGWWPSWLWFGGAATAPGLANSDANPGFNNANPDRRRVAGSALILESDGTINEPSIPNNAINKTDVSPPQNAIFKGTDPVEPIATSKNIEESSHQNTIFDGKVDAQPIPEPKVDNKYIVE